MTTQVCNKCGKRRVMSKFSWRGTEGRYRLTCKDCYNERSKQLRREKSKNPLREVKAPAIDPLIKLMQVTLDNEVISQIVSLKRKIRFYKILSIAWILWFISYVGHNLFLHFHK